jgi:hypothetical protein
MTGITHPIREMDSDYEFNKGTGQTPEKTGEERE